VAIQHENEQGPAPPPSCTNAFGTMFLLRAARGPAPTLVLGGRPGFALRKLSRGELAQSANHRWEGLMRSRRATWVRRAAWPRRPPNASTANKDFIMILIKIYACAAQSQGSPKPTSLSQKNHEGRKSWAREESSVVNQKFSERSLAAFSRGRRALPAAVIWG